MRSEEHIPLVMKGLPEKRFSHVITQRSFLMIWLCPILAFVFTSLLWAYGYMYHAGHCIIVSTFGIGLCIYCCCRNKRGSTYSLSSFSTLPAIVLGSVFGLYLYDQYNVFPEFYRNSRKYTNVVPSEPAAAIADAGKLTFSVESFVDVAQSSGLIEESGEWYCVAPVRDGSGIERIQFWAVGIGCCGSKGDFHCDASRDPTAKGGVVVFDNQGIFGTSRFDHYDRARMKAQAEYSLQSAMTATYVRWVRENNLDLLANSYRSGSRTIHIVTIVVVSALHFVACRVLYRPDLDKEN